MSVTIYGAYKRALTPVDLGFPHEVRVVTFEDHSSALAAKDARIAELLEALEAFEDCEFAVRNKHAYNLLYMVLAKVRGEQS